MLVKVGGWVVVHHTALYCKSLYMMPDGTVVIEMGQERKPPDC